MSTLPTRSIAHAYITEHDLQNILNRAVNACVHAKAADPIGFIIEHLKAVKEAAASNTMVAQKKEEATTPVPVVPAVTSEMKEKPVVNKPSEEEAVAWFKANGYKKKKKTKMFDHNYRPVEYESECDTDDEDGRYPTFEEVLLKVATSRDLAKVEVLFAKGADVKAVDKFGYTPLHLAAM